MNFYKRYIGDIQRDTGHLSLAEMGAYDRLLDHYYATEERLPADKEACYRIARAMSKDERKAVDSVLGQFFYEDGGYAQGRAEREITQAQPALVAARTNGARGGRPKKTQPQTQEKPSGFPEQNPTETQGEPKAKPPQNQNQNQNKGKNHSAAALLAARGVSDQTAADWIQLRKTKRAAITPTALDGIEAEAGKAGMTLESALQMCCRRGWQGFEAGWVTSAMTGQSANDQAREDARQRLFGGEHAAS